MVSLAESITALTATLTRLPGIGPPSVERIALHLVRAKRDAVRQLAERPVDALEEGRR